MKHRLTALVLSAAGGAWLACAPAPVDSVQAEASATHAAAADGDVGISALDVYAHDGIIDVLTVSREPGGSPELRHQRSRDGGGTWSDPTVVEHGERGLYPPHRGMDPQVAAHGETVVVLWTTPGTSRWGSGPLATAISRDGGRIWTAGPNPVDTGSTEGHSFLEIVADRAGEFHAFWLDSRDGAQGLRTAVSRDGGVSWSANVTIDARTCECCWNTALPAGRGRVFVLYRDKDPRDMRLALTVDGGRTWTRGPTVGAFDWGFDGCPHVGGGLALGDDALHAVVWTAEEGYEGLHVLRSRDSGSSWTVVGRAGTMRARHADVAAAGDRVIVVWDDVVEGVTTVFSQVSMDGGTTWRTPVRVSADGDVASHPKVVEAEGVFVAFWTARGADGALRLERVVMDYGDPTMTERQLTARGAVPGLARP